MTAGATPLVSVIIPARNARSFIADAVASVLRQSYERLECIVVDDGSTDGTVEALSGVDCARLAIVSSGGAGSAAAARNAGFARSLGELIAFLDADDIWHPQKLERQVELFRRRPDLGLVWCGYVITGPELRPITEVRPRRRNDLQSCLLLEGSGIAMSSTGVVSRAAYESVGGFDARFNISADLDLADRLMSLHPVDFVEDVLVAYRSHPGQMHVDLAEFEADARRLWQSRQLRPSLLRRGSANLATRLFFSALRRHPLGAWRHLRGIRFRWDRLLLLPLEAMTRRASRRLRKARFGIADPRTWSVLT